MEPLGKPKQIVRGQKVAEGKVIRAKQMRSEMTSAEQRLWQHIRAGQLGGYRFRRQQIIEGFIADFYCHSAALVIEVDGLTHEEQADREREKVFEGRGIRTLRFQNGEVFEEIEHVLAKIQDALKC